MFPSYWKSCAYFVSTKVSQRWLPTLMYTLCAHTIDTDLAIFFYHRIIFVTGWTDHYKCVDSRHLIWSSHVICTTLASKSSKAYFLLIYFIWDISKKLTRVFKTNNHNILRATVYFCHLIEETKSFFCEK